MSPVLTVSGLAKTFTMHLRGGIELPVIAEAAFALHPGTCAVLGGPSGAGKSSILKMLYGNYAATAGKIVVRHRGADVDLVSADPRTVLCDDLLAPEGYGEIIGGSQREDDHDRLLARIREEGLPEDAYRWYLDLRKYGSFPHSGFGLGVERTVGWITGRQHIREMIAFPRMLNRIYP